MEDMSKCTDPEYCAMFPRTEDRLDLLAISKLCRRGRYDDTDADAGAAVGASSVSTAGSSNSKGSSKGKSSNNVGIGTLFEDLARMTTSSKAFNACNAHFLPWRLADMMERAVRRLKARLAQEHRIPSLLHSLQQDEEDLQEQLDNAKAVDM